jgi:hypothetical protein
MTREAYRGSSMMRLTGRSLSELPLARVAFVSVATPSLGAAQYITGFCLSVSVYSVHMTYDRLATARCR